MHKILVVPGLGGLPQQELARSDALARLAALAVPVAATDLEQAMLSALGVRAPVAPLAALGAGVDVGDAWFVRADPVTLAVGRDDVRLVAAVDDMTAREAGDLHELLDNHFAGQGLHFWCPRPDAWFAASPLPQAFEAVSLEASVGRTLKPCLPTGPDAARWRRWLTEVQMLLHEHPLAGRGERGVNGIWFAGGGSLAEVTTWPPLTVRAGRGRLADLARGLARDGGDAELTVHEPVRTPDDLVAFDAGVLAPVLDALAARRVTRLTLITAGSRSAALWSAEPPGLWRRLVPGRATFTAPRGDA